MEIKTQFNLKEELDRIDFECISYAEERYLDSRLKVLVGMWEKGEIIYTYRGGKSINYSELERQTGRDDQHLKRWHDTYQDTPNKEEYIERITMPKAIEWRRKALKDKNVHVSNNSGENEWYTPSKYIESARMVMGCIDLDPASSEIANKTVKAGTIYTKDDNGLTKKWIGNVWLNPPYSQPLISMFSDAIVNKRGEYEQAIVLVNNATETQWLSQMLEICDAVCFLFGRVKFIDIEGNASGAPLQGQCVIYFGDNRDEFENEFKKHGICLERM